MRDYVLANSGLTQQCDRNIRSEKRSKTSMTWCISVHLETMRPKRRTGSIVEGEDIRPTAPSLSAGQSGVSSRTYDSCSFRRWAGHCQGFVLWEALHCVPRTSFEASFRAGPIHIKLPFNRRTPGAHKKDVTSAHTIGFIRWSLRTRTKADHSMQIATQPGPAMYVSRLLANPAAVPVPEPSL